jgi:signal transduction histidine kinase
VVQWERTAAALVVLPERGQRRQAQALAREASAVLAVVVQRDLLLTRSTERERQLAEEGERRLARLAFDIHDGPLQDLAAVGLEISTLRSQLGAGIGDGPDRRLATERMEGVLARLVSVESELRDLSTSLEPAGMARRPLRESLEQQLALIEARDGLQATLEVRGDISETTPSQRIALARIVQESVRNGVDHGGARTASVRVESQLNGIHVEVRDDGRGFDVDAELADAARRGRLGVISMSERVRLLGGHFDISSRPGGPTIVTVRLPWWRPLAEGAQSTTHARP